MDSKARFQKQHVEKTEQMQENELRQLSKKIRSEQVGSNFNTKFYHSFNHYYLKLRHRKKS